jgi:uroporphyrinogen-III synthase
MIYILSEKKFDGAENIPCIQIKFINKSIDLSSFDALIFSSKNGVEAIERINKEWRNIPSYSIGQGTSIAISHYHGDLVYEAKNSYGDDFAQEIKQLLKDKKTLFLRAKVVTSSLGDILLNAGVDLKQEVVYETVCGVCDSLKKPQKGSIMIFSSPSTIACFFRCFTWDDSYQAVVIGTRTASFMPKDVPFVLSAKQTIPDCINLAQKLSKKAL